MENTALKYSVTAVTDLQGFSHHLEVGSYDLRTNIGKEAIRRLETLENSIKLLRSERKKYKSAYPKNLRFQRINDAIIFTIDLPDFLLPSLGEAIRGGLSPNEMGKYFDLNKLDTYEKFERAYNERLINDTMDLGLFIGLVSRLHQYVNRVETEKLFPRS